MPQNVTPPPLYHMTDYVLVPDLFTPEECLEIVHLQLPVTQAQVIKFKEGSFSDLSLEERNTKVKSINRTPQHQWIYQRLAEKTRAINAHYYQFALTRFTDLQLLEYENTGFYNTHVDIGTGESSTRKLSIVVFLTERSDYTGGELLLKPGYPELPQTQGSAVFFPSYLVHEIKPVTAGVRHTLVTWIVGPCFK